MGRASSPDQRREEGGQRKDERRPRWVDVKRAHHAVISRHFVCFDVVSAAAAASAPGWGVGAALGAEVHAGTRLGLSFRPSGTSQGGRYWPSAPSNGGTFTFFDRFDVITQQRVAFDKQGASHLGPGILAVFINNIFMLIKRRRRWNRIGPPCH